MHIASPNAGEIIQGFAVAFKKGLNLTHEDLLDCIGIHPTIAEELVSLTVRQFVTIHLSYLLRLIIYVYQYTVY